MRRYCLWRIVCIAIALSGDVSQDLKTGALLGATPRYLQLGEMLGVCVAAVRAGWVLFLLHKAYTHGSGSSPAPQSRGCAVAQALMSLGP
jgi:uncharacterized oligopeptide transporter (OPT) family protein